MKIAKFMSLLTITVTLFSQTTSAATYYRQDYSGTLQSKEDGKIYGDYYVPSSVENILWGRLPNKNSKSILTIPSGSTVTFDTLSHEGLLEDQGRNPVKYFSQYGIQKKDVLNDAIAITSSDLKHDFDGDGPHIVTGPIAVEGAKPGDVLKVEVLALEPRVSYGVISNRHYKGALEGEFPENSGRQENASAENPKRYNNVSIFTPIKQIDDIWYAYFDNDGREIKLPIHPFLGIMGVAPNTNESWSSIPPTHVGGNIDINELGIDSTLYLPIEVEGGLFYTGDPHFVQGDGEVALTALEGSLRGTVRLTVLKKESKEVPRNGDKFVQPFGETENYWIPIGLNKDLDLAMKQSVRESVDFISKQLGVDRALAYAYLSAGTDYEVSQVVDKTKGIHALIPKIDFQNLISLSMKIKDNDFDISSINNQFYIDAENIFDALGEDVVNDEQNISININNKNIKMMVDSNKYIIDGKTIYTESSPMMYNNQLMLPVSALSEVMGMSVTWSTVGNKIIGNVTIFN